MVRGGARVYNIVSPVLAALCDPLLHAGVESLSAHMTILAIGVQQPPQGGHSVLPRTLSCHALQVVNNGGGQHLPWRQQRCRKQRYKACMTAKTCLFKLA